MLGLETKFRVDWTTLKCKTGRVLNRCILDIFCEVPNKKPTKFEYVQNSRRKVLRQLYKVYGL